MPSSALVPAMQRHALVFAGDSWQGMWMAQPFTCPRGHTSVVAPRNLIRQRVAGCQQCATEGITARAMHSRREQVSRGWTRRGVVRRTGIDFVARTGMNGRAVGRSCCGARLALRASGSWGLYPAICFLTDLSG
ncbi:hypothetical protein PSP6_210194 [Paraburkholderia tropica]|nr:hypothetical protein PSP6_210194 [Paraburkholderia tropica]